MSRFLTFVGFVFLAIGSFFLYIGLREYLFPIGWRTLYGAIASAGIGFPIALVGIVLLIIGIVSNRRQKNAIK